MDPESSAPRPRTLHRWEWPVALLLGLGALLALSPAGLSTPYWWDAAAVYAPGARWVAEHHFAALPGVFPSDLSRGHTTLYYLFTALFFRLFGPSPLVGHALSLGFSALALAYTYALGTWLFGRLAGLSAVALMVASPLYLTMSFEALPEVPLAALTVAALYAFARGRHPLAALVCTLVVLTKETGVACPLAILGAGVLWMLHSGDVRSFRRPLAWTFVSLSALGLFFVWQRVAEGWWVLPYHAALFREEHHLGAQFVRVATSMFTADGRWIALVCALCMGLWRARRGPPLAPDAGSLCPGAPPRWVVLAAFGLLAAANLVFFTKMFFLERYVLGAHPGVLLGMAGVLVPPRASHTHRGLSALALAALLATLCASVHNRFAGLGYESGENTFRYLSMVEAHQSVFRELEAMPVPQVVLTTWPIDDELRDPALGWVRRPYPVSSLDGYLRRGRRRPDGRRIDVVLTSPGLGAHGALLREARSLGMHLVTRAQRGGASLERWSR